MKIKLMSKQSVLKFTNQSADVTLRLIAILAMPKEQELFHGKMENVYN